MTRTVERLSVGLFVGGVLTLSPGLFVWHWWTRRRRPAAALPRWRGPS